MENIHLFADGVLVSAAELLGGPYTIFFVDALTVVTCLDVNWFLRINPLEYFVRHQKL